MQSADVNAAELSGRTPLHDTINKGHINLMELLLASGTDPRVLDVNWWTALDKATWRGRQDIVEVFARHGVFAWQGPPDCPLPSKDRASLVKSALEIAFHEFQPGDNNWLEFAVPIVRFSCFYLKMLPHGQRATQFMPSSSISSRTVERICGNVVVLPGAAPRAGDVYHA